MCQLNVKVAVKCQILNKQILDIMSCPLYKPYTNGRISLDVQSPCCPCVKLKVTVKGQILDIMSRPLYKPYTNGRISFKLEWHIHLN